MAKRSKKYAVTVANADGTERTETFGSGREVTVAGVFRLSQDVTNADSNWFGRKAGTEYVFSISRDATAARSALRQAAKYGTPRLAPLAPVE